MDFAVDVGLLVAARSIAFSMPTRLLLLAIVKALKLGNRRREMRLSQFLHWLVLVVAFQYLRLLLISKGVHQMIGNFSGYVSEAQNASLRFARGIIFGRNQQ
jgi:hypothetical protein